MDTAVIFIAGFFVALFFVSLSGYLDARHRYHTVMDSYSTDAAVSRMRRTTLQMLANAAVIAACLLFHAYPNPFGL